MVSGAGKTTLFPKEAVTTAVDEGASLSNFDDARLSGLGYKPELQRKFTLLSCLAVGFSVCVPLIYLLLPFHTAMSKGLMQKQINSRFQTVGLPLPARSLPGLVMEVPRSTCTGQFSLH